MRGYVHVYTGDGKGKTAAALGLALRAAGAGLKIYIAQFLKEKDNDEIKALRRFSDLITVEQFGHGGFGRRRPASEDIEAARKGLESVKNIVNQGRHHVVILDEANLAVSYGLFSIDEIVEIIDQKPDDIELVITGRAAAPRIIAKADLVSEWSKG
jgi:cob(I)alamin adenosyltransferase